jgi:hypothetical protein
MRSNTRASQEVAARTAARIPSSNVRVVRVAAALLGLAGLVLMGLPLIRPAAQRESAGSPSRPAQVYWVGTRPLLDEPFVFGALPFGWQGGALTAASASPLGALRVVASAGSGYGAILGTDPTAVWALDAQRT